jgi:hypothetical protein
MSGKLVPRPEGDHLSIWTVYVHPKDYPNKIVARESIIGAIQGSSDILVADEAIFTDNLSEMIAIMLSKGLTRLSPNPTDDPVIESTWV